MKNANLIVIALGVGLAYLILRDPAVGSQSAAAVGSSQLVVADGGWQPPVSGVPIGFSLPPTASPLPTATAAANPTAGGGGNVAGWSYGGGFDPQALAAAHWNWVSSIPLGYPQLPPGVIDVSEFVIEN